MRCWALCYAVVGTALLAAPAASYINKRGLDVVKTVTLPNGQVIDWVRKKSQGEIASEPPEPPTPPPSSGSGTGSNITAQHPFDEATRGPEGTVPILRDGGAGMPQKLPPNPSNSSTSSPSNSSSRIYPRQYQGKHWYVTSNQYVENHGGAAYMSVFKAHVANSGDFSLLQTAVVRQRGRAPRQTVEAGWVNQPSKAQNPYLFTFYTTNNYKELADYKGGWNTEYKGWVQVDSTYYPGIEISPVSVVDGDQYDLHVRYLLSNGSWWLSVNDKWIGYYPASLFTQDGYDASETLESKASDIAWYGEVYQADGALTTTDMGSGHYAAEGYGKAAYFHNLLYTDTGGQDQRYDGSRGTGVDDAQRYTMDAHWDNDGDWASFFFLGGPGAGGQIGE